MHRFGWPSNFDIVWHATRNQHFEEAVLRTAPDGPGALVFTVPRAALGTEVSVEFVAWIAPPLLGVVRGRVPGMVPSG